MSFLKGLGDQMIEVKEKVAKMEKRHSSRGLKRNTRTGDRTHQAESSKDPTKKLFGDFDDVVADQTNPDWNEEDATMDKEGSKARPASSEGRSVSVFDRVGKKLSEHDLRLKLVKLKTKKDGGSKNKSKGSSRPLSLRRDRERSHRRDDRPPSPRREREQSHHRDDRPHLVEIASGPNTERRNVRRRIIEMIKKSLASQRTLNLIMRALEKRRMETKRSGSGIISSRS